MPVVKTGRWRLWLIVAIGLAATGSLLAALITDPPHLMAAGLSAVLGWLACYAYALQLDCWRLTRAAEVDLARQTPGGAARKDGAAGSADAAASNPSMDLDVTGLARSLGSPLCNTAAPGVDKSGQTMQAVLTSALVKEYLRCSSLLQKYQSKHGILASAPQWNPGFAEALVSGLNGSDGAPDASPPPRPPTTTAPASVEVRSSSPVLGGTPNFADRLAAVNAGELFPKTGAAADSSHEVGSPTNSSNPPPPPPAAELERCHTLDNTPGFSSQASPEAKAPAARSAARHEDLDHSISDPPWLRAVRRA